MNKGYTLIEVLIAIVIFCLISGTAMGVFASVIKIQKYSLASQQLLDQTSYAVEYMSRAIRMAKKDMDGVCSIPVKANYGGDETHLKFKSYNSQYGCQEFFLENKQLKVKTYNGTEPAMNLPLISDDFEVTSLKFVLSGAEQPPTDSLQPKVTMYMEIKGKGAGFQPKIKIQTTVSQRDFDIEE